MFLVMSELLFTKTKPVISVLLKNQCKVGQEDAWRVRYYNITWILIIQVLKFVEHL